jgi:hypothetical protein
MLVRLTGIYNSGWPSLQSPLTPKGLDLNVRKVNVKTTTFRKTATNPATVFPEHLA